MCLWPDTDTMKTPNQICAASVWIWKGGIKKNCRNIFSKFSPNLSGKAVSIDKDWPVTYLRCLPMRLSNSQSLFHDDYTMRANLLPILEPKMFKINQFPNEQKFKHSPHKLSLKQKQVSEGLKSLLDGY